MMERVITPVSQPRLFWRPIAIASRQNLCRRIRRRLLLDSRVVDLSRSPNLIVVTLCSLKLSFSNGLKKGIALLGQCWSLRPWNPIRARTRTDDTLRCACPHAEPSQLGAAKLFPCRDADARQCLPRRFPGDPPLGASLGRRGSRVCRWIALRCPRPHAE